MNPIDIMLRAVGGEQVEQSFRSVARAVSDTGGDLKAVAKDALEAEHSLKEAGDAAKGLDGDGAAAKLRDEFGRFKRTTEEARDGIKGVESEVEGLNSKLGTLGEQGSGFDRLSAKADAFQDHLDASEKKVAGLKKTLESVRNVGIGMTAAGAGGLMLANKFEENAKEGLAAQDKMEAMLRKRGEGGRIDEMNKWASQTAFDAFMPDDDPIREAAAQMASFGLSVDRIKASMPGLIGQARLMDVPLSSVATMEGKAFASGNAGMLKKAGVTLSEADIKYVKEANNELEKQARLFEVVKKSLDEYSLGMADGMSDGEKSANRLALALDDVQQNLGEGALEAQGNVNSIIGAIFDLANASPDVEKAAGVWLTYGSYALTAAGSVLTVGAQVAITASSLNSMGITGTTAMAAIRMAALGATGTVLGLGLAAVAAAASIAIAVHSWNLNKDKILNPTSSYSDSRTADQVADDNEKTSRVGEITSQTAGLSKRDRYVVLRRATQAYLDLGETDAASNTSSQADALRKQLPKNFKDPESIEAKSLLRQLKGMKTDANKAARFDGSGFNGYHDSNATPADKANKDIDAKIEKMKAHLEAMQSGVGDSDDSENLLGGDDSEGGGEDIESLQEEQWKRKLAHSKHPADTQLAYRIWKQRQADKANRDAEREDAKAKRDEAKQAKQSKSAADKAAREAAADRAKRVREALYQGASLDANGGVSDPGHVLDGSDEDEAALQEALQRKDGHDRAFHLGAYKPPQLKGLRAGRGRGTKASQDAGRNAALLAYLRGGGSVLNMPSGLAGRSGQGDAGSSGDDSTTGPRTGAFSLDETSRSQGSDGTEVVKCEGTLTLKSGGRVSLSGLSLMR